VANSEFYGNKAVDSGGGVSIDSTASLQMFHIKASNNNAQNGDGGFLFARLAGPILLSDVSIKRSGTGHEGGGGGVGVYSTQIALERVSLKHCRAGERGGGAILLGGEAEGHLLDCDLDDNSAEGASGGHISCKASSLVVHGKGFWLKWPGQEPIFPNALILSAFNSTSMTHGVASINGGAVSCIASSSKQILNANFATCQSKVFEYGKTFNELNTCIAEDKVDWKDIHGDTCAKWSNFCKTNTLLKECSDPPQKSSDGVQCEVGGALRVFSVNSYYYTKAFLDDVRLNCPMSCQSCTLSQQTYLCPSKGIHFGSRTALFHSTAIKSGGAVAATLCAVEMNNVIIFNSTSLFGDGGAVLLSSGE
jgi:hypothetical protein